MAQQPATESQQRWLRFVSDAAHDLVGPVDQVSSLVALFVRRYRGQLDQDAQDLLGHIESAGARLTKTAAGLRAYLQVAGLDVVKARVSSKAALESAILNLNHEIKDAHAEILPGELPEVEADSNLLTILFRALLRNSLLFRPPDVTPRITISAEPVPAMQRFTFADNGIGIDAQFRDEVFLAFRKLNGHSYPGAGMGLTLARAIVETLDGKIWIEEPSQPGTKVVFELPA